VRLLRKSASNAGIVVRRLFAVAAVVDQIATTLTA
jgi:hypothetical protein